ncbi:hypothetical protein ACTWQB_12205 [Piscibacillus sp. B03]|uniref:hypothetical protein n=1 Tax=Piscibacillus sp. B03 TaxID=3457430 RepID=UPI003FCEC16E
MEKILNIFKKVPLLSVITFLIVTIIFSFTILTSHDFYIANNAQIHIPETYENKNIYQISDNAWTEDEHQILYGDSNNLISMNNFIKDLKLNDNFYFQVSNLHPIGIADQNPDVFSYLYEEGAGTQEVDFGGVKFNLIKGAQLDEKTFSLNNIELSQGRMFNKKEYYWSETIPVILGNDYKEIYSIGDNFKLHYLFQNYDAEVIGFLKSNQTAMTTAEPSVNLNRYIVMPPLFYNNDDIKRQVDIDKISIGPNLSMHTSGFLITKLNEREINSIIDDISKYHNHEGYYISDMTNHVEHYLSFNKDIRDYLIILLIFAFLLVTYSVLVLRTFKTLSKSILTYSNFSLFIYYLIIIITSLMSTIVFFIMKYYQYEIGNSFIISLLIALLLIIIILLIPILLFRKSLRT